MKRLILMGAVAAAASMSLAAPASARGDDERVADEERRAAARQTCRAAERCPRSRPIYPWFFLGQDEGGQSRRPVRRLSIEL